MASKNIVERIACALSARFCVVTITFILIIIYHDVPAEKQDVTSIEPIPLQCKRERCVTPFVKHLNVHLIAHSHNDVGGKRTFDEYYNIVKDILGSVVEALKKDPNRRFIQAEMAYFWKWWENQTEEVKASTKELVKLGRLVFVNGAWSMNDEAATYYQSIIDQFTLGLKAIKDTFGNCAKPLAAWQIDSYGHSREMASILYRLGYNRLVLGRIDYRDHLNRKKDESLEFEWRLSHSSSALLASVLYDTYSSPTFFCWGYQCWDAPLFATSRMVEDLGNLVRNRSLAYRTSHIMMPIGGDFAFQHAEEYFTNIDKLLLGFKYQQPSINIFYSTPYCYMTAVYDEINGRKMDLQLKTDDFFPYASDANSVWSGYYTSRPNFKRNERAANNLLQVAKHLVTFGKTIDRDYTADLTSLKETMGIIQHHNVITGTAKQHVTQNFMSMLRTAMDTAESHVGHLISGLLKKNETEINLELATCFLTNISHCEASNSKEFVVAIYNPLSWYTDHYVRLPVNGKKFKITGPRRKRVPYDVMDVVQDFSFAKGIKTSKYELVFKAASLPPLGLRIYHVDNIEEREETRSTAWEQETSPRVQLEEARKEAPTTGKSMTEIGGNSSTNLEVAITERRDNLTNAEFPLAHGGVIPVEGSSPSELQTSQLQTPQSEFQTSPSEFQNTVGVNTDRISFETPWVEEVIPPPEQVPQIQSIKQHDPPLDNSESSQNVSLGMKHPAPGNLYFGTPRSGFRINPEGQLISVTLDGKTVPLKQNLLYYSSFPDTRISSGHYVFRPDGVTAKTFTDKPRKTYEFRGEVVDEVHQEFNAWVKQIIRVYKNESYVEFDWIVGPIETINKKGVEVISRFETGLNTGGVFYTDSNGRGMVERKRNFRPTYAYTNEEPVAGNYYPVTSRIAIRSEDLELTVLTDRSQGGSSLSDGAIELMVHRKLLQDDGFGIGEALDDREFGKGVVARGQHFLTFGSIKGEDHPVGASRELAVRKAMAPWVFLGKSLGTLSNTQETLRNTQETVGNNQGSLGDARGILGELQKELHFEFSGLRVALPRGLHISTLEPWNDEVLLRLENIHDKSVHPGEILVDLSSLFDFVEVMSFHQMSLGANERLGFPTKRNSKHEISLLPMEIKTFILKLKPRLKA